MTKIKHTLMISISVFLLCSALSSAENGTPTTAILGALEHELKMLEAQLTEKKEHNIIGIEFVTGKMNGRQVVVGRTGVGKVNAAMTATLLIEHFSPSEAIVTGTSGKINPELRPGDIIIAEKTAQHDLGDLKPNGMEYSGVTNPISGVRNPVFFETDPRLLELAKTVSKGVEFESIQTPQGPRAPQVTAGVIVTGDVFVASEEKVAALRKNLQADAVEMEGAAIAQICSQHNVPCLVIRSISDSADSNASEDYKRFHEIACNNSAKLVSALVKQLGSESEEKGTQKPYPLNARERAFQEMLSNVTLVGHFTLDGEEQSGKLREERYTIRKVTKMKGDFWLFLARVQYGGRDVTVPLPLAVKWAGDTPMITLTDLKLPKLGTYTARVIIYRGQYAGTWSGGSHGGQMFGKIIKNSPNAGN